MGDTVPIDDFKDPGDLFETDPDEGDDSADWEAPEGDQPHILVLTGTYSGKVFRLEEGSDQIIGRDPDCDIQIQDTKVSRHHARLILGKDGRAVIIDLESSNGTYLNKKKISEATIQEGDKIRIGRTVILKFSYQDDLEIQVQEELFQKGTKDPLTGVFNRQYFMARLESEFSYSTRHQIPCSLLMVDFDQFKAVNDEHGHLAGDYVLEEIVHIVTPMLRSEDLLARYGGDEFVVILRGTDSIKATQIAERIRLTIEKAPFEYKGTSLEVTMSIGVGTNPGIEEKMEPEELIQQADEFLYKAKEEGRNRVCSPISHVTDSESD